MIPKKSVFTLSVALACALAFSATISQASMTIDLRFQDGSTTKDVSAAHAGDSYVIDVWATIVNASGTSDASTYLQWISYDAVTLQQNTNLAGNITAGALGDSSKNSGKSTALWNGTASGTPDGNATGGTPQVITTYGPSDAFADLGGSTSNPATNPQYPRADAGLNTAGGTRITAALANTYGLVQGIDYNVNATANPATGTIGSTAVTLPAHSLSFLVGSFTFTLASTPGTVSSTTNAFQIIPGVYQAGSPTILATSGTVVNNTIGLLASVNRGLFSEGTTTKTTVGVYLSGTPIQFTLSPVGPTNGQYVLTVGSGTLSIMKGDATAITTTLNNTGTGFQAALDYTNLGASITSGNTLGTLIGNGISSSAGLAQGNSATNSGYSLKGTGYGNVVLTNSASVTNHLNSPATAPTNNTTNTTITINVGRSVSANAGTGSVAQLTTFGSAMTAGLNNGNSYAGYGTQSDGSTAGSVVTSADLLDGTAGGARTIRMAWRTRATNEISANPGVGTINSNPPFAKPSYGVLSDVVQLSGLGGSTGTPNPTAHVTTDTFVLQMTVTDAAVGTHQNGVSMMNNGQMYLGWLDDTTGTPIWKNAVEGNSPTGTWPSHGVLSSYASYYAGQIGLNHNSKSANSFVLGDWGVQDLGAGNGFAVWAVLDHNSIFAVVPEPSSFVMLGIGLVGFVSVIRRRRKHVAQANNRETGG